MGLDCYNTLASYAYVWRVKSYGGTDGDDGQVFDDLIPLNPTLAEH